MESFQDLPRHFAADGDLLPPSHLAAALSAVFLDGQDFFVRSLRHFRDQITDPALEGQVPAHRPGSDAWAGAPGPRAGIRAAAGGLGYE